MLDCKEYVKIKKEELKEKVSSLNTTPCLVVFQIGDNPASNSYVNGKIKDCEEIGIKYIHEKLNINIGQKVLEDKIKEKNQDDSVHGIIVQLPLPDEYDVEKIQEVISPKKDVDGFHKMSKFKPCTPLGIMNYLKFNNIDLVGKKVCVIGRSDIVGLPMVNMMIKESATVFSCNSKTKNLREITKQSDIVISAIGKPLFLDETYFSDDTIIVDVGINRKDDGKLCGDVNREQVISKLNNIECTSVPGGVGLLTRLQLIDSTINASLK